MDHGKNIGNGNVEKIHEFSLMTGMIDMENK